MYLVPMHTDVTHLPPPTKSRKQINRMRKKILGVFGFQGDDWGWHVINIVGWLKVLNKINCAAWEEGAEWIVRRGVYFSDRSTILEEDGGYLMYPYCDLICSRWSRYS